MEFDEKDDLCTITTFRPSLLAKLNRCEDREDETSDTALWRKSYFSSTTATRNISLRNQGGIGNSFIKRIIFNGFGFRNFTGANGWRRSYKRAAAGIAMGLVMEMKKYKILTDIQDRKTIMEIWI